MMEDLGSGFYLAMHDLEIRGAGEVLGEAQSGEMQEVGFQLYADMLRAAVSTTRTRVAGGSRLRRGRVPAGLPALRRATADADARCVRISFAQAGAAGFPRVRSGRARQFA